MRDKELMAKHIAEIDGIAEQNFIKQAANEALIPRIIINHQSFIALPNFLSLQDSYAQVIVLDKFTLSPFFKSVNNAVNELHKNNENVVAILQKFLDELANEHNLNILPNILTLTDEIIKFKITNYEIEFNVKEQSHIAYFIPYLFIGIVNPNFYMLQLASAEGTKYIRLFPFLIEVFNCNISLVVSEI